MDLHANPWVVGWEELVGPKSFLIEPDRQDLRLLQHWQAHLEGVARYRVRGKERQMLFSSGQRHLPKKTELQMQRGGA